MGVPPVLTSDLDLPVEAMGLEPTNLLTASQALYQLSYAPGRRTSVPAPWRVLGARGRHSPVPQEPAGRCRILGAGPFYTTQRPGAPGASSLVTPPAPLACTP